MATANEIEIRVTVDDKTKAPFQKIENRLKQGASKAGEKAGDSFSQGFSKGFNKTKGGGFGRAFGSAFTGGFKSFGSLLKGTFETVKNLATGAFDSLAGSLGKMTGGLAGAAQSVGTLGAALAVVGAVAGPATVAIGALAAIVGGTLVVGLGAGIAALGLFSQRAKDAFSQLGTDLSAELGRLADSSGLADALINMANQFRFAFGQIKAQISDAMTATAPLVASLARGITDLATNAMPGIVSALQSAGPVFEGFKTMLGDLGTGIGEMFAELGQHAEGFKQTFTGLGEVFKQVLPSLGEFAGILADKMGPVLQQIAPALKDMVDRLGPPLAAALEKLGPLMPGLIDGFTRVMEAIIPLVPPLTEMAIAALPALASGIELVNQVMPAFKAAFEGIVATINFVVANVTMLVATMKAAWQAMTGDFEGAKQTMIEAGNQLAADLGVAGTNAGQGLSTNLRAGVQDANEGVMTGTQNILSGILGFQGRFESGGRSLGEAFKRGIISQINEAVSAVQAGVERIAGLFGNSPAKWGPFSGRGYTKYRGQRLMEAFAHGIRKGNAKLKTTGRDAMGNVAFSIFGHKHKRGRNWGQLASGSISGLPGRSAYAGAGAPSASMLGEHYNRQSKQIRNAQRNVSASQITVTGDADGAIATMISKLIRTGKLRIA